MAFLCARRFAREEYPKMQALGVPEAVNCTYLAFREAARVTVYATGDKPSASSIISGFRAAGISPYNASAVAGKITTAADGETESDDDDEEEALPTLEETIASVKAINLGIQGRLVCRKSPQERQGPIQARRWP